MTVALPTSIHPPVRVLQAAGSGPLVLLCEHASAYVPPHYAGLGMTASDLLRHIAWDPGALALASALSEALDSPLVAATHSRLLIDLNREPQAHDSIVEISEGTLIPGNQTLSQAERQLRRDALYRPFHHAIDELIDARLQHGLATAVVSIHSFTPVYLGQARIWHAGVLSHRDRRMAEVLLGGLRADPQWCIGDNQPYAPDDGVYHTAGRHGEARGLPSVMLEVRQDLLADAAGVATWAARLAPLLARAARHALPEPSPA